MKLIQRPITEIRTIDVQAFHGQNISQPGFKNIHCTIAVPSYEDPKSVVWNKLKYGALKELNVGTKIDMIVFEEDKLVLYGVLPVEVEATIDWDERIYKCYVDHYKVIE